MTREMRGSGGMFSPVSHAVVAFLLAVVCGAVFFNSLNNPFMIDDHNVILWDSRGHNPGNLLDQFIPDYRSLRGVHDLPIGQYFRPWAHIIPLASYSLFRDDPFGYHLLNLLLFYLACLSIYAFLYAVFRSRTIAGLTALFFAVHPVNGLMVNYITASVFSFQIIMTMLGMIAAVKYVDGRREWGWLVLSLLGFLNAVLCHETGLAFPFYVLAYLWILRGRTLRDSFKSSLLFWVVAGAYFYFRMNAASLKSSILENIFLMNIDAGTYAATFAKLLAWYLRGLTTLQDIVLIKAVAVTPDAAGWWIAGLVIFASTVFLLGKFVLNAQERFAGFWFAVGFLPVTLACFFQYRAGLIIEPHWLIVGSIGFFLFLTLMLMRLKLTRKSVFLAALVLTWTAWNVNVSWSYNRVWGDEVQYCLRWMKESPTIRPISIYLGHAYLKQNKIEEAKECFMRALSDTFFDYEVFNNLGGIAMQEGQWDLAEQYFRRALILHSDSAPVHSNLGVVYFQQGLDDAAEKSYLKALRANPYFMDARDNLAGLYSQQERWEEAAAIYEDGLSIDPFNQNAMVSLIGVYLQINIDDKLQVVVTRLMDTSRDPRLLLNTAVRLAQAGKVLPALACFEKSLRIDPGARDVYAELGKFLGNLNRFDEAVVVWTQGAQRHPDDKQFGELIRQAQNLRDGN